MFPAFSSTPPVLGLRAAHLDLKGVPPTFERLLSLLDVFAAARYNAILMEWEDSFPWTVDADFRSETAYTPRQVRQFMQAAADKGLEVIPLVQCLGHLETVLSLPRYAPLREIPDRNDVLNPLADGAGELIRRMVDDVLALSPGVRYFHLGGDEAWTFGSHPDTRAFIERHGKDTLYLQHIQPLLNHLAGRHIRPILWHDMMVHWSAERLGELAKQADLMVWGYKDHPDHANPAGSHHRSHIDRLKKCGLKLWCAGAFKGGDRMDSDLPDFPVRRANALAWAEIHRSIGFVGAVATGWSRFNTCGVQICPIDAALDSLVDLGHIFHDGRPLPDGQAGCQAFVDSIGEGARLRACRHAMQTLATARAAAWENVIFLRELMVTTAQDPRRRAGTDIPGRLEYLRRHVGEARQAADDARQAFDGLIPDVWMNRYLDERIIPLTEELDWIERRYAEQKKRWQQDTQLEGERSPVIATSNAAFGLSRAAANDRRHHE
ncbi:MAG: family 20 glycosylhydrolase [Phycisphaerales bacterium]